MPAGSGIDPISGDRQQIQATFAEGEPLEFIYDKGFSGSSSLGKNTSEDMGII
ncbi:MAG: hypothetical protein QNJ72_05740 [Pleurocapsa sp. MO_226.B13]|nr:hypothetical protein [Pleurocapsa sp. MO_226.B13]